VPAGVAGFSWSWFCWSTNGFSGAPGSIVNTNLLMGDYDTLNIAVMQYLTPYLAPLMLSPVPVRVTVALVAPAVQAISLSWATRNGTALAGVHYVAASGTLTFAAGQGAATLQVMLLPRTAQMAETLAFAVAVTGAGVAASGTVTIAYAVGNVGVQVPR
jgi:hypothetical protein